MSKEKKPSILVVEDTARVRQAISHLLMKKDYRILNAHDAYQALNIVKVEEVDLILLDVMMPGINGFELCEKLKSDKKTETIPVIFLTAKTKPADIVKGFKVGAVDYIKKPYNTEELLVRVTTHMNFKKTKDREKDILLRLEEAEKEVKFLSGLIPICISCKKIRVDKEYRRKVKEYLETYGEEKLSSSICSDCKKKETPKKKNSYMDIFKF